MRAIKTRFLYFVVGTFAVFSFQGCDQISKLVEYFSPKKTIAKPSAPAPISVKPLSEPAAPAARAKPQADLASNVLAKVGSWSITIDEFKEQEKAAQELAKQNNLKYDLPSERLLGMIVEQQLLFQEAQRQGLEREGKIAKQINEARKLILSQTLQSKMVEGIKVTDEDIKAFYDQNKQFYYQPAEYKLSEIVVDAEEEANGIFSQLAQGADFAGLVQAKSKVKPDGNFVAENKLASDKLRDVVKALDEGKFSNVFKGPDGFYIVKLEQKKSGKERTLEEVKEGIKADLSYLKYLQGLQQLQTEIPVQTNLKLLEAK